MDHEERAREVRERMAELRKDLECDVQSVTESTRAMADWRFYVQRFPLATAAAVGIVGYMLIPRRPQVIVPDAETLAKLAKHNQVWVKTGSPKANEPQRGMLGSLLVLAAGGLTKVAMAWASEQVKSSFSAAKQHAHEKTETEEAEPRPHRVPR